MCFSPTTTQTSGGTVGAKLPGVNTWPRLPIMVVMKHLVVGIVHRTGTAPLDHGRFLLKSAFQI